MTEEQIQKLRKMSPLALGLAKGKLNQDQKNRLQRAWDKANNKPTIVENIPEALEPDWWDVHKQTRIDY